MSVRIDKMKAVYLARQLRADLEVDGKAISMGHVYEALAAASGYQSYTDWRLAGWPRRSQFHAPLVFWRMMELGHPTEESERIARAVKAALTEKD